MPHWRKAVQLVLLSCYYYYNIFQFHCFEKKHDVCVINALFAFRLLLLLLSFFFKMFVIETVLIFSRSIGIEFVFHRHPTRRSSSLAVLLTTLVTIFVVIELLLGGKLTQQQQHYYYLANQESLRQIAFARYRRRALTLFVERSPTAAWYIVVVIIVVIV